MAKKSLSPAQKRVALVHAYKSVFAGPMGEQVLADLMSAHSIMGNSYNGRGTHPVNDMLIKEGERLVILRILKMLNINVQELRERIEAHEKSLAE